MSDGYSEREHPSEKKDSSASKNGATHQVVDEDDLSRPANGAVLDKPSSNVLPDEPKPKTLENQWYDAVFDVFGLSAQLNGQMRNILRGKETRKSYKQYNVSPPLTEPDEIRQWGKWWKAQGNNKNLTIVTSIAKVQSSVMGWIKAGKPTAKDMTRPEPEDPFNGHWRMPDMMPEYGAQLLDVDVKYDFD